MSSAWLRHLRALVATAVVLSPMARPLAQTPPPNTFGALHWRMIGPYRGGRTLAAAGVPGQPGVFYIGAVAGGVWKTVNDGVTWTPIFDDQPVASIGAIAIAPSDPNIVYVGTGEADMRSDISFGAGVYRSSDAGAHWTHLGLDDTRQIGKLLVDPHDPNVVLLAALGHGYGANAERGVYRTTDGGKSWSKVLAPSPQVGAIDLAADPDDAKVVYASLWAAQRTPWEQYPPNQGPGSGIYKSRDGGATWTPITGHGFAAGQLGRIGLTAAHGGRVYALVDAPSGAGLYRSDDAGGSWRLASSDARIVSRGWYFGGIYVDPQHPDVVYSPNVSLLRSTDGGATFAPIKGGPGGDDYHLLWIDPQNADRLILGSDQGAAISLDRGATWSSWYNQPTAQFYHVIADEGFPYWVYGAQQDIGTVGIASRSDYGSITYRDWMPVGAGESGYIAPDPLHPEIVYGGNVYGQVYRFDKITGQSQDVSPWPLNSFGQPMPLRKLRFTWTSPLVFDRVDRDHLYLGSQYLLATHDGGVHWAAISPDLTSARPSANGADTVVTVGDAGPRGYGVIFTIAPSPLQRGVIWVGTDDGLIQLTTDSGKVWQKVTPEGVAPWSQVSVIEASPLDARSAYAAVDRHRLDDYAPYIYKTRDYGKHWTRADHGIAPTAYVHAVRADPARPGLLYAGTELGVYVSIDDGEHWQPLQLNLPVAPIHDLVVHDHDLVVATHGRGFWVLDDLTPLEQGDLQASVHLYKPATAVRIRRNENRDTPIPPEEPQGENPPTGTIIDYQLPAAASAPVTLEILDHQGTLVRRFVSTDSAQVPRPPQQIAPYWFRSRAVPTSHAGHNRFVWDLRYPTVPAPQYSYSMGSTANQGTTEEPLGPLVLPGSYQVRLKVGDTSVVQGFDVAMDPRVHVAESTLRDQLRLAMDVWNAMADANALARRASALSAQLRARPSASLDKASAAGVSALARRADSVAVLTSADDLAALAGTVQSADGIPTQPSRDVLADLRARLTRAHDLWSTLEQRDVPALNARLGKRAAQVVVQAAGPQPQLAPPE